MNARPEIVTNLEYNGDEEHELVRFTPRALSIFGYANGMTLWNYQTLDRQGQVLAEGYFGSDDPYAMNMRAGDFILAKWLDGGGFLLVSEVSDKVATVKLLAAAQ